MFHINPAGSHESDPFKKALDNNNIKNQQPYIIDAAYRFTAWNNRKPILVIGKETLKELSPYMIDDNTYFMILNLYGYSVEHGNFDFGWYLK